MQNFIHVSEIIVVEELVVVNECVYDFACIAVFVHFMHLSFLTLLCYMTSPTHPL